MQVAVYEERNTPASHRLQKGLVRTDWRARWTASAADLELLLVLKLGPELKVTRASSLHDDQGGIHMASCFLVVAQVSGL